MRKIIVGSINKNAGKTSMIVGLAAALGKKVGYIKPLGDRLLYRKKRLWDYDSALITHVFKLKENPEDMSLGFEHAKLRYMYDEVETKKKLNEMIVRDNNGKDVVFMEGPEDISCGMSIHLDVISVATNVGGRLVLVVSGKEDTIVDDITFVDKCVNVSGVDLAGIIINKVHDVNDFRETYIPSVSQLGIKVLGVVPFRDELDRFTVRYLADGLFAKVLTAESALGNVVYRVFVGAMSASDVLKKADFRNEPKKLVITVGDRSDMVLAAMETGASGIILTNNIVPPPNIVSKATELKVPLLLVAADTYQVAKQIDGMLPLITKDSKDEIELLGKLVSDYVNFPMD